MGKEMRPQPDIDAIGESRLLLHSPSGLTMSAHARQSHFKPTPWTNRWLGTLGSHKIVITGKRDINLSRFLWKWARWGHCEEASFDIDGDDHNAFSKGMDVLLQRVQAVAQQTGSKDAGKSVVPEGESVDEFTHLKREINLHIRELRNSIKERDTYAQGGGGKDDTNEIVRQSNAIRTKISEARAEAARLREMVTKTERQRSAKGKSVEDLENRRRMCDLVDAHIDECDRWFKGLSFASVTDDPPKRLLFKGSQLQQAVPIQADFKPPDATETKLEQIDGINEWRLLIQATEQEIDTKLDSVVVATAAVAQLAKTISHEYEALGIMVDEVEGQMTKTGDNLDGANEKLADVKKKLASGKNCCIDLTLFVIMIALIGFLIWKYT
jgi:predicted  nucleic acid-binding Zn-ribbon protein